MPDDFSIRGLSRAQVNRLVAADALLAPAWVQAIVAGDIAAARQQLSSMENPGLVRHDRLDPLAWAMCHPTTPAMVEAVLAFVPRDHVVLHGDRWLELALSAPARLRRGLVESLVRAGAEPSPAALAALLDIPARWARNLFADHARQRWPEGPAQLLAAKAMGENYRHLGMALKEWTPRTFALALARPWAPGSPDAWINALRQAAHAACQGSTRFDALRPWMGHALDDLQRQRPPSPEVGLALWAILSRMGLGRDGGSAPRATQAFLHWLWRRWEKQWAPVVGPAVVDGERLGALEIDRSPGLLPQWLGCRQFLPAWKQPTLLSQALGVLEDTMDKPGVVDMGRLRQGLARLPRCAEIRAGVARWFVRREHQCPGAGLPKLWDALVETGHLLAQDLADPLLLAPVSGRVAGGILLGDAPETMTQRVLAAGADPTRVFMALLGQAASHAQANGPGRTGRDLVDAGRLLAAARQLLAAGARWPSPLPQPLADAPHPWAAGLRLEQRLGPVPPGHRPSRL